MRKWGKRAGIAAAVTAAAAVVVVPASANSAPVLTGDTVLLPNLDDDSSRCQVDPARLDEPGDAIDTELAACNDAADDVVNGHADEADLARVDVAGQPGLGDAATGRLTVAAADHVRVFVKRGRDFQVLPSGGTLSADELRRGVRLAVEATDVIRDPAVWDGTATLTLTVSDGGTDTSTTHAMRVAPLLLQNDLQRATTVFAGKPGAGLGRPDDWSWPTGWEPGDWDQFSSTLRSAGAPMDFVEGTSGWWQDVWWQDMFEPAVATAPRRHGVQTMRVLIRSANIWDVPTADGTTVRTPRPAARQLFSELRGPDVAVVQQLVDDGRDGMTDLRNATGNIESVPPYAGYPQGRMVYGGGELAPEPSFLRLLTGQGQQPPIEIDTSWLMVGHADETVHVVRADNERGWTLMVADPRLAEQELRDAQAAGAGGARLFEGTAAPHQPTVDEVLANQKLLADNETAAGHIDGQITVLLGETGLRADELVRVPVLFHKPEQAPGFVAATPGIVNGVSLDARRLAAPDPHGPKVNGVDVFRAATERALRANGVRVSWVEDLRWAHFGGGEVHCTTNALRDTSRMRPWW
jgi:protein-arginine deiminase